jgi:hypothetical protein
MLFFSGLPIATETPFYYGESRVAIAAPAFGVFCPNAPGALFSFRPLFSVPPEPAKLMIFAAAQSRVE